MRILITQLTIPALLFGLLLNYLPGFTESDVLSRKKDIPAAKVTTACDPKQDSISLLNLWNATNGSSWTVIWDQQDVFTAWPGLTFNLDSCVTEIYLANSGLTGLFPDNSFQLEQLETLTLADNNLEGELPQDLSRFPVLKELHLYYNNFSGQLSDFQNAGGLEALDLNNNRLEGPIPNFTNLSEVSYLDLQDNFFVGTLPDFDNLDSLVYFSLYRNRVGGQLPDFSNLKKLEFLDLNENNFNGTLSSN